MRRLAVVATLCVLALTPVIATAADPDPKKITPPGYDFCGWQDFVNGGWAMEWSDDLSGAYLVLFADGMSCQAARRNVKKYNSGRPVRLLGYRCMALARSYEYADVRCVRIGGSRRFRYQTGS